MFQRALAVILALVTFWSAFATQELHWLGSEAVGAHAATGQADRGSTGGSVEEHLIDDQPGQLSVEQSSDQPAWFPATRRLIAMDDAPSGVVPEASLARCGNVPGVPQRPPCA
jgi:hypothetical protein